MAGIVWISFATMANALAFSGVTTVLPSANVTDAGYLNHGQYSLIIENSNGDLSEQNEESHPLSRPKRAVRLVEAINADD